MSFFLGGNFWSVLIRSFWGWDIVLKKTRGRKFFYFHYISTIIRINELAP